MVNVNFIRLRRFTIFIKHISDCHENVFKELRSTREKATLKEGGTVAHARASNLQHRPVLSLT